MFVAAAALSVIININVIILLYEDKVSEIHVRSNETPMPFIEEKGLIMILTHYPQSKGRIERLVHVVWTKY